MESPITRKILLVDDDPLIVEGFKEILSRAGFVVTAFSCPKKLLNHFNFEEIEEIYCVIFDVDMPEMTGIELYQMLYVKHPMPPVVFISGVIDHHTKGLDETPNCTYLKKPFSYEKLIETISLRTKEPH